MYERQARVKRIDKKEAGADNGLSAADVKNLRSEVEWFTKDGVYSITKEI